MNIINEEEKKDPFDLNEGETASAGGGLPPEAAAADSSLFVECDHTASSTGEETSLVASIQTLQRMKTEMMQKFENEIELVILKQIQCERTIVADAEETFEDDDGIEQLEEGREGKWLYDLHVGSKKNLFRTRKTPTNQHELNEKENFPIKVENSAQEMLFLKEKIDRMEKIIDEQANSMKELNKQVQTMSSDAIEEVGSLIPRTDHNSNPKVSVSLSVTDGQTNQRMRMSMLGRTPAAILGSPEGISLDWDTFSLMMISPVGSSSWILGFSSFGFQMTLGIMILIGQFNESVDSSIFDAPFKVNDASVRVAQFLSIILCLSTQSDILTSIRSFLLLGKGSNWAEVVDEEGMRPSRSLWIIRVGLPNTFKLSQGLVVTFASFVIIVQNKDTIDLLKDFISLMVISEFDNILFQVAAYGYLGEDLRLQTHRISDVDMFKGTSSSERRQRKNGFFFVRLTFTVLLSAMFAGWGIIFSMQSKGNIFDEKFPSCGMEHYKLAFDMFGDDKCYGGPFNTLNCKYEDGDCANFNTAFPNCNGENLVHLTNVEDEVGNGKCNINFAIALCEYDGGDCCPYDIHLSTSFGDGKCNGGLFNTEGCLHDFDDCDSFNRAYPTCTFDDTVFMVESGAGIILGDGICDGEAYNVEECGFEYGDCMKAQIGGDVVLRGVLSPGTSEIDFKMWMSADGSKLLVELPKTNQFGNYDSNSVRKMSGYVYNSTMLSWVHNATMDKERLQNNIEESTYYASVGLFDYQPPMAMAGDGSAVAVGSPLKDLKGRVDIFDFWGDRNHYALAGLEEKAGFGFQLDITGDGRRIAVSSPASSTNDFENSGKIQIFEKSDESQELWTQVGGDIYGYHWEKIGNYYVGLNSLDGTRVFLSTGNEFDNNPMLRIYQFSGTQGWAQLGSDIPFHIKLDNTDRTPVEELITISADGNRFALSSYTTNEKVQIYDWHPDPTLPKEGSWNQLGPALSSNDNGFGRSISMNADGTLLAISAVDIKYCDEDLCPTGSVQLYQYKFTNPPWRPFSQLPHVRDINGKRIMETQQQLKDNTVLGLQLALSGDGAILTASGYDIGQDFGFVKVFDVSELFYIDCLIDHPEEIGSDNDGECRSEPYYTEQCGYDGGNCPLPSPVDGFEDCKVAFPELIGDERCDDYLPYNSEQCNYDGGDCPFPSPVKEYPNCFVSTPQKIGDGECDNHLPFNSYECGFDGGDCIPPEFVPTSSPSESMQPSVIPSPNTSSSQSPSASPSVSAEPSKSLMPTTINVEVNMELLTDYYPQDTSWSLTNNDQGGAIVHSGSGSGDGDTGDALSLYIFMWTLNRCTSYSFTISDSFGDGLVAPGYAELKVNKGKVEEVLGRIDGSFGFESTISFSICDDDDDS